MIGLTLCDSGAQKSVVAWQDYLHEVLVVQTTEESTIEKLDNVVYLKLIYSFATLVHKIAYVFAIDYSLIRSVDSCEAAIRLKSVNSRKLLPLKFNFWLFFSDKKEQFANF